MRRRRPVVTRVGFSFGGRADRKSGVWGKRGDLGGGRIIKKKKKNQVMSSSLYNQNQLISTVHDSVTHVVTVSNAYEVAGRHDVKASTNACYVYVLRYCITLL